jgi:hypothetical protein
MSLTTTQLHTALQDCYDARIPLIIIGGPGIGKSQIVGEFTKSIGQEFHPFNAAALDPSSFGITIPRADNTACDLVPTAQFVDQAPGSVQFLDELDKMDTLIQNTILPLIQENRLHGVKLSDRWNVMAANYMANTKGSFEISGVLRNRCVRVEYAGPTIGEWLNYASRRNLHYKIQAFLSLPQYNSLLNAYDPKADASPTPRQWENCSRVVNSSIRSILMCGMIGAKATAEFEVFDKLTSKLPSYQALVASNGTYTVPDDFTLQSILATMIGAEISGADAEALKPILDQLPVEFVIVVLRRAMERKARGIEHFIMKHNYVQMMHAAVN